MAEHATVYCARTLKHLTYSMLWTELQEADWLTLGEVTFDVELDQSDVESGETFVDAALQYLRMEPTTSEQLGSFEIYYRPQGLRPIQASVAELPTVAVGWAKEMLEDLDARAANRSDGGFAQVCAHLKKVQAIVDIQFSTWPSDDPGWPMGEVITYETARWIARNAEGLMEDHRGTWWALADTTWWNKVYDGRPSS